MFSRLTVRPEPQFDPLAYSATLQCYILMPFALLYRPLSVLLSSHRFVIFGVFNEPNKLIPADWREQRVVRTARIRTHPRPYTFIFTGDFRVCNTRTRVFICSRKTCNYVTQTPRVYYKRR